MELVNFKKIISEIHFDVNHTSTLDNYVTIQKETEHTISIFDALNGEAEARPYTIRDPKTIDAKYLSSIIRISDEANKLNPTIDTTKLIAYLDKLDKNMLMTVQRICFITDDEEENDSIYKDPLFAEGIEAGHGIGPNQIGVTWWDMDVIVINLKNIKETTEEIVYDEYEFDSEFNIGILTTIVHEIRHSAQNNMYLPEKYINPISIDPEADAEEYARNWVDTHHESILFFKKEKQNLDS